MKKYQLMICFLVIVSACETTRSSKSFPAPAGPLANKNIDWPSDLSREAYYDKVLGMLVGSAIGDAMGAPVEMWDRRSMDIQYGFIDSLINVRREGSPEGPWEDNLQAGATTDDTRWKYLTGYYLLSQVGRDSLDAVGFAEYIVNLYQDEKRQVQEVDGFGPEQLERELMHMTWLQEWAKVAKPFAEDDLQGYSYALNRFYGGEMACAGMLYSPMIGGIYPGQVDMAYTEAFRLGFFDLGYARDITALTSAYVAKAMQPGVSFDEIARITQEVDPLRYFNSRLVGRLAHSSYVKSLEISYDARRVQEEDVDPKLILPVNFKGSRLEFAQLMKAYELLDRELQQIPFHAGEIHIINLTALEYSKGDFRKAMEFIVNFGRDNDTVAAVTGAILGAYSGYKGLPESLAAQSLETSRTVMGMDLEDLANRIVDAAYGNSSSN